jgi:hypothetical protein
MRRRHRRWMSTFVATRWIPPASFRRSPALGRRSRMPCATSRSAICSIRGCAPTSRSMRSRAPSRASRCRCPRSTTSPSKAPAQTPAARASQPRLRAARQSRVSGGGECQRQASVDGCRRRPARSVSRFLDGLSGQLRQHRPMAADWQRANNRILQAGNPQNPGVGLYATRIGGRAERPTCARASTAWPCWRRRS